MPYKQDYFRQIYGISNLAADMGGLINMFSIICLSIVYPISRHFFYTDFMQQLFYVNTSQDNLMKAPSKNLYENDKNERMRLRFLPQYKTPQELKNDIVFKDKIKNHKLI